MPKWKFQSFQILLVWFAMEKRQNIFQNCISEYKTRKFLSCLKTEVFFLCFYFVSSGVLSIWSNLCLRHCILLDVWVYCWQWWVWFGRVLCKCEDCKDGKMMGPSKWERHTGCKKKKWKESIKLKNTKRTLLSWVRKAFSSLLCLTELLNGPNHVNVWIDTIHVEEGCRRSCLWRIWNMHAISATWTRAPCMLMW